MSDEQITVIGKATVFYDDSWREMPCEEWSGLLQSKGYGVVRSTVGKTPGSRRIEMAHIRTWEECFGPIPDGLYVLHKCDNRRCRQPLHLWLGTSAQNSLDASQKGRLHGPSIVKTHCIRNHEFTAENTYRQAGRRHCRACRQLRRNRGG